VAVARSSGVPRRIAFAVGLVAPRPGLRVLEVGSGPGVAAALVCAHLGDGSMLAVDRSATAVARAVRRNAEHVAAGRLEIRTAALAALETAAGAFDVAFTVDVNVFWTGPATAELAALHRALRPGAALHLCWGTDGPQGAARLAAAVRPAVEAAGFTDVRVVEGPGALAVSARRP
jgi:SAM-dependent methyltransferase